MMEEVVAGAGGGATGLVAMPSGNWRNAQAPFEEAGGFQKEITEQWDQHRAPIT